MFGNTAEKRIVREADKVASLKEDLDALSWSRVLEIGKELQSDASDEKDLGAELVSIAQSNLSLAKRLGLDLTPPESRVMASGMEIVEGGLAEAALEERQEAAVDLPVSGPFEAGEASLGGAAEREPERDMEDEAAHLLAVEAEDWSGVPGTVANPAADDGAREVDASEISIPAILAALREDASKNEPSAKDAPDGGPFEPQEPLDPLVILSTTELPLVPSSLLHAVEAQTCERNEEPSGSAVEGEDRPAVEPAAGKRTAVLEPALPTACESAPPSDGVEPTGCALELDPEDFELLSSTNLPDLLRTLKLEPMPAFTENPAPACESAPEPEPEPVSEPGMNPAPAFAPEPAPLKPLPEPEPMSEPVLAPEPTPEPKTASVPEPTLDSIFEPEEPTDASLFASGASVSEALGEASSPESGVAAAVHREVGEKARGDALPPDATSGKRGQVPTERGERPSRQRFARFRSLYESRDGGLCVFEDEHGHLVAVDASKLA